MALHSFAATEVASGDSNLDTALVYEQPDDSASWLSDRGHTSLSGGTAATSKAAALNGTTALEAAMLPYWRGVKIASDQLRLLPAAGAYRADRRLLLTDEIPEEFLEAYRLTVEKTHAGTLPTARPAGVRSHASLGGSITYSGGRGSAIEDDPDIWPLVARVLPPL